MKEARYHEDEEDGVSRHQQEEQNQQSREVDDHLHSLRPRRSRAAWVHGSFRIQPGVHEVHP